MDVIAGMDVIVAGLPFAAAGAEGAGRWTCLDESTLRGEAGPRTDLFVDPGTGEATLNAPRLLTPAPEGDFQLSAQVTSALGQTYDAGALVLWADQDAWAKLAFEYSPQGSGMVVSVVTRGRSDDANGQPVAGDSVGLRISRVGPAYAFHACAGAGGTWALIRHFTLGRTDAAVGFEVQSPTGDGCAAMFNGIAFAARTLADLRDGS